MIDGDSVLREGMGGMTDRRMSALAHGCIQEGQHHQKGADSLRLKLLLMEMMMFCLLAVQWKYVCNSNTE